MAKASDQNGFDGDWTKVRGAIRIRYEKSCLIVDESQPQNCFFNFDVWS